MVTSRDVTVMALLNGSVATAAPLALTPLTVMTFVIPIAISESTGVILMLAYFTRTVLVVACDSAISGALTFAEMVTVPSFIPVTTPVVAFTVAVAGSLLV